MVRGFAVVAVLLALLAVAASAVWAAEFRDYWEFRYAAALPGGGFGVTPDCRAGFDGAMQINIPVAYTPGPGNVAVGYWAGSVEPWHVRFDTEGPDVNGTALIGAGVARGLWVSYMATAKGHEACWNVQWQICQDRWERPAIAVGVVDLSNRRDAHIGPRGYWGGARSVYVVATGRRGTEENFVYITLGWGNGRFNSRPFGGITWPRWRHFSAFAEYDGWDFNVGMGFSLRPRKISSRWNIVGVAALVDLDRPVVGACFTYSR